MQRTFSLSIFGKFVDVLGKEVSLTTDLPCSAGELKRRIARAHPDVGDEFLGERVRICVDDHVVEDNFLIGGGRVEILSPVSGG